MALHRDPRAAFVYDTDLDDVDALISVVRDLHGKVWITVPLSQALAEAGLE